MKAPPEIANAARNRIRENAAEFKHSLKVIAEGKPQLAEPESSRRTSVIQVRKGVSASEARRIERSGGPEAVQGDTIDFVDVSFLERGMLAARAVCRIVMRNGQGLGSGFMISPHLLLTNNHVIRSAAAARGLLAEFDFERDLEGVPRAVSRFALDPERAFLTDDQDCLDFTVIAIGQRESGERELADFGYLPLSAARNKHQLGDFVNLIQHPDGRMKEAVVRENRLVSRPKSGTVVHYVADTEPGSSGSPVFNVSWEVVALHHWGAPHRELIDEHGVRVPRTVNEGIRVSAIVLDLETKKSGLQPDKRVLIDEALTLGTRLAPGRNENRRPVPLGSSAPRDARIPEGGPSVAPDGTATWHFPLSVSVRLGYGGATQRVETPTSPTGLIAATSVPAPPGGEARLELDENYQNRSGYSPAFLQSVIVPLPKLTRAQVALAAKNKQPKDGDPKHLLRYEHFSVVMNAKRRLAFYTATNIDGANPKDVDRKTGLIVDAPVETEDDAEASEASEVWFIDERIKEEEQTPVNLFSGQTAFDSDGNPITNKKAAPHRNRIFQQGHLTRRQDPLWGNDDAVVLRAHADTFHVTNRSPQVGFFNMGVFKPAAEAGHPGGTLHWRALEDFVLNNARADGKRVTVFTGPIFDDENDILWERGRDDMKGFRAPLEYWKLLLRVENGVLHATAFIADQKPLIDFVPELIDLDAEAANRIAFSKVKRFHVSVQELSDRTGLDFGSDVEAADTFKPGPGEEARRRPVKDIKDFTFERTVPTPNGRRATNGRANGNWNRRKPTRRRLDVRRSK